MELSKRRNSHAHIITATDTGQTIWQSCKDICWKYNFACSPAVFPWEFLSCSQLRTLSVTNEILTCKLFVKVSSETCGTLTSSSISVRAAATNASMMSLPSKEGLTLRFLPLLPVMLPWRVWLRAPALAQVFKASLLVVGDASSASTSLPVDSVGSSCSEREPRLPSVSCVVAAAIPHHWKNPNTICIQPTLNLWLHKLDYMFLQLTWQYIRT
jgi:hypothetical protein